jgi:hypothetical protein
MLDGKTKTSLESFPHELSCIERSPQRTSLDFYRIAVGVLCALLVMTTMVAAALGGALVTMRAEAPPAVNQHDIFVFVKNDADNSTNEIRSGMTRQELMDVLPTAADLETFEKSGVFRRKVSLASGDAGPINATVINVTVDFNMTDELRAQVYECQSPDSCYPKVLFEEPVEIETGDGKVSYYGIECDSSDFCVFAKSNDTVRISNDSGNRRGVVNFFVKAAIGGVIGQAAVDALGCFPANTLVFVCSDGKATVPATVPISTVEVGQEVLTSTGCSPIYLMGHNDPTATAAFIQASTNTGHVLELTPLHYAISNDAYVHAKDLKPGDKVKLGGHTKGSQEAIITEVRTVAGTGLFNPYTASGDIVVVSPASENPEASGLVASVHSDWFLEDFVKAAHVPYIYQALLAPVRAIHAVHPKWNQRFAAHFKDSTEALDQQGVTAIVAALAKTF